ncbi:MAG: AbrB/MazE/SpoVT family DNA-binding domain-containing protein [Clostridia bacterium]|nr:AbrB/MazE/SpoVT family DNA-binding domain-containing protein [Clostridia bacterium]
MEIKIIRKIDELGRIVIPKDVRVSLDLHAGDDIEIKVESGCVVLTKVRLG